MLPPLDELLDVCAYLQRRHRFRWELDPIGVEQALREAAALAGGRPEDEPAALFLALTRRRNDSADAWATSPAASGERRALPFALRPVPC